MRGGVHRRVPGADCYLGVVCVLFLGRPPSAGSFGHIISQFPTHTWNGCVNTTLYAPERTTSGEATLECAGILILFFILK